MNLDQYRALKAQEAQASVQTPTQPATQIQEPTPIQPEVKPTEIKTETIIPEKIAIEGIGEVTIDELKNGYLRQSDYTRKTQEVSRKAKEVEQAVSLVEQLKSNPQITKQIFGETPVPSALDPTQNKIVELETKLYDVMLEREIESLQSKYSDFEVMEVLKIAQEKNITNLEDAYILAKSHKEQKSPNQKLSTEDLEKQIREKIMKEIEQERSATQTIISSSGNTNIIQDNSPQLSDAEKKVARMMKLSESDYAKWRDIGQVKK